MKSKKSIYLLLPLVLGIWGAVLYQFFSFSGEEEQLESGPSEMANLSPLKTFAVDTAEIDVNFRDPFLGGTYQPVTGNSISGNSLKVKRIKKEKPVVKIKEPLVWPDIKYKGIVSDTKNKNKVFMLVINGRTYLMKIGSTESEVTLMDGDRETIDVKYKKEVNLILIEE
ncbi:hypothetical protein NAT51_12900 [Flavobacterium amniphilum]|uniref:hypothetical protein n=1 Tax=Flavobacterium amniphilum TaxID=1834035 RepID=UPI00202AAE27|nr:hypothetical protein [Flavobacterium amniphilum]MCL9806428.1 hypothetical protein [Flavobacterium amniphilum]